MKRKEQDGNEEDARQSKRTGLAAKFKINPNQKKHQSTDLSGGDKDEDKDTIECMLDSLPYDLKLDILTRLPAKSLVNFRCVSKMWSSIIRSPEFVSTFSSISRPRLIVALSNGLDNNGEESLIFFFSFEEVEESSSLVPDFEMSMSGAHFGNFSGSCTSVHEFLVVEAASQLRICNPFTEQLIKFPNGTFHVGYDPIADQYKALSVRWNEEHKVITFGEGGGWRLIKPPTPTPYLSIEAASVSINGFVYYGAYYPTRPHNPGIVCFDVRSEKLTYIKAPYAVVANERDSAYFEYKGKLASIASAPNIIPFQSFDLWVLEDVGWSKTTCVFPHSVWDVVDGSKLCFPGTNKAGEIIIAPRRLPRHVQPYYIFYYNVETKNMRRVRLHGIGDNQEFRRSYGFIDKDECHVHIAPQHIKSIDFLKINPYVGPRVRLNSIGPWKNVCKTLM